MSQLPTNNRAGRNTREAAAFLNATERTLIRWRNEGVGPAYIRAGHKVIYRDTDLEAFLDAHRVVPVREVAA